MILYHYSNKNFKGIISPEYFGENSFTANDKKFSIKRSFFYLKSRPEKVLKDSKYLYLAEINKDDLYDLRKDPQKVKSKFFAIDELLQYLKANYKGIIYNVGFDIVLLFCDVKIVGKMELYLNP